MTSDWAWLVGLVQYLPRLSLYIWFDTKCEMKNTTKPAAWSRGFGLQVFIVLFPIVIFFSHYKQFVLILPFPHHISSPLSSSSFYSSSLLIASISSWFLSCFLFFLFFRPLLSSFAFLLLFLITVSFYSVSVSPYLHPSFSFLCQFLIVVLFPIPSFSRYLFPFFVLILLFLVVLFH